MIGCIDRREIMYKIFVALLTIVWVLDILNLPFMTPLDVTYPINGLAWFLIWVFLPATSVASSNKN